MLDSERTFMYALFVTRKEGVPKMITVFVPITKCKNCPIPFGILLKVLKSSVLALEDIRTL